MSNKGSFVHLHNHTEYSLLDGVQRFVNAKGKPSEMMTTAAEWGMPAMAITDHGNLYGAVEFYGAAKAVGIKPILGVEAYVARNSRFDRKGGQKDNTHLTLLAKSYKGYQNLMHLISKANIEGFYYDPRIDKELLSDFSEDVICLSGCLKSEIAQAIVGHNEKEMYNLIGQYQDIFGKENFFLEVMDHGLHDQKIVNDELMRIHKKVDIPLVATNDCHYFHKHDWEAHDCRVCISTGKLMEESKRLKFETHEFYLKDAQLMRSLFPEHPEACDRTLRIAEMTNIEIPMDTLQLPKFQVPKGDTQDSYLRKLCIKGLEEMGKVTDKYIERLDYELGVIKRMGFSGYFLIVWDFIKHARENDVPVGPGRGSGAGSIVAYSLSITLVDPLQYGLLFERFLNPDRLSMPDLDIDFSDAGRESVIRYVREKYGEDHVAQIITFGSMNSRSVIRDVGRVINMPLPEVDRIAKLIPMGATLDEAKQIDDVKSAANSSQMARRLFKLAEQLEGTKRHTGVHAAGTVITDEPVTNYVALAKGSRDVVTTQAEGTLIDKLGLLKVDFLGLRTLTIIDNAVKFIQADKDPDFNIHHVPFDDRDTFELLQRGDCFGVFQLESSGMRDLVRSLKPSVFTDIVALIALYRPGPMQAGMLEMFVERKHGREAIKYDHKKMEPILKDTYGCILYQEQVMNIAKALAGFTPGEADKLRKAMGKKIQELMDEMRRKFIDGCVKDKISEKLAKKIFDQMEKFGGYGFNKSHSVAYGVLSYQTAYLKAKYPLEFMTALISSEIGRSTVGAADKENKMAIYLEAAKHMDIAVLPPDIQHSVGIFSVEPAPEDAPKNIIGSIRYGLLGIKGVGSGAVDSIIQAREEDGAFKSLDDFCRRIDTKQANKKVFESMVKGGALDSVSGTEDRNKGRAMLLAGVGDVLDRQARIKADLDVGQGLLFGAEEADTSKGSELPSAAPMTDAEILRGEKDVLGVYFSGHPLEKYEHHLKRFARDTVKTLNEKAGEVAGAVKIAGLISSVRRMTTKAKGEPWAKCTLEDLTGEIPLLVFPRAYASGLGRMLDVGKIVVVEGKIPVGKDDDENKEAELIVDDLTPMSNLLGRWAKSIRVTVNGGMQDAAKLRQLQEVFKRHPGDVPVELDLKTDDQDEALLETEEMVTLDQDLFEDLDKTLGENSWRIVNAS